MKLKPHLGYQMSSMYVESLSYMQTKVNAGNRMFINFQDIASEVQMRN